MSKKIISVGQAVKYEKIVGGIILLIIGLCLSLKESKINIVLMMVLTIALYLHVIYSFVRDKKYEREQFDEMAVQNLNRASRMVLIDQEIIYVGICIPGMIFEVLKSFLGIQIPWNKYFQINYLSIITIVIGIQFLLTGIHFRKLERE